MQTGAVGNIIIDRFRKRIRLLKHHADLFAQRLYLHIVTVNILAANLYGSLDSRTRNHIVHPIECPQQCGFAAARRTDKCGNSFLWNIQGHILKRLKLVIIQIQFINMDDRFHVISPSYLSSILTTAIGSVISVYQTLDIKPFYLLYVKDITLKCKRSVKYVFHTLTYQRFSEFFESNLAFPR
ncbi:hypothetical protein D3C77_378200 [compost metagenome]